MTAYLPKGLERFIEANRHFLLRLKFFVNKQTRILKYVHSKQEAKSYRSRAILRSDLDLEDIPLIHLSSFGILRILVQLLSRGLSRCLDHSISYSMS